MGRSPCRPTGPLRPDRGGKAIDGILLPAIPAVLAVTCLRVRAGACWRTAAVWAGLGLYALAAADMLFFPVLLDPAGRAARSLAAADLGNWTNFVPLRTVSQLLARGAPGQAVRQIGGNVGLLLPVGIVLPMLLPRVRELRWMVLMALSVSVGIEAVQYLGTVAGFIDRSMDVDDVLLNVLGAAVGWGAWRAGVFARAR